jgi:hypothetical protein
MILSEEEFQKKLGFKTGFDLKTPIRSNDFNEICMDISDCIYENIENYSIHNEVIAYIYIQSVYIEKRKMALIDNKVDAADCCLRIIIWIDRVIDNLHKIEGDNYFKDLARKTEKAIKQRIKNPEIDLNNQWNQNSSISFENCIDFLRREYPDINGPFIIINKENNLCWNKTPFRWRKYLVSFIYTCLKNNLLVREDYSSGELLKIIEKTFSVYINPKPLKSLRNNPPLDLYLKPFKRFKYTK